METKTTEVAITADLAVPQIMDALGAELKKLKAITDRPYQTSGDLTCFGFGKLKDEKKVENLIRAWSMIEGKEEAYKKAAESMGLKTYPAFTIDGALPEAWKSDISTRLGVIQYEDRKNTLESYQACMSKFLSEQDQKSLLVAEMTKFLKGE